MTKDLPDGIYLDLPLDKYLALPRISSSGLTSLMEGPAAFWANSWMNPHREDSDSAAALLGRAYHCARLEPDKFHELYVRDLVQEDYPDGLLTNATQIGEALFDLGLPKQSKDDGGVMGQARRLAAARSERGLEDQTPIWILELEAWEQEHRDGREALSPKAWAEIHRDADRLRSNPEVASLISGGLPEVSILFTDPESGVRCKIRPDYIAPGRVVHLKTWDSKTAGKPGNVAVADAFRFNGFYRTGWFYNLGLSAMIHNGLKIHDSDGALMLINREDDPVRASVLASLGIARLETWFLFLRRSGIPDIRARRVRWWRLPRGVEEQAIGADTSSFHPTLSALAMKADIEVRACLRLFKESLEIHGESEWYPRDMMGELEDDDFSSFWLDAMSDPR